MSERKPKVLVGMSGGVDSSVTAALLLEQGYEVIGAFMKNWSGTVEGPRCVDEDKVGEEFAECGWKEERRDAMRVAAKLGIPFLTFDFEKEYRALVVEEMFQEFEAGRTPNPDILCNRYIKFDLFMREADKLGCDFVATGHYARTSQLPNANYQILRSVDELKDQTYFLWAIDPKVLPRVLFPVGSMTKPEVREKARELGLSTADKKDSVGICFVGEVNMKEFLQARIPKSPGKIVTTEGKEVGEHEGLSFYTIGQRDGVVTAGGGIPYYVVEKRRSTNELIVSSNFHPLLFRSTLSAARPNWFHRPDEGAKVRARIRHRGDLMPATIQHTANGFTLAFDGQARAVTPGQSVVIYDGEAVLGGGIIQE